MKINLISNLDENPKIEEMCSFNSVVAYSLHKAFEKKGVETRFIRDHNILTSPAPTADHVLVTSAYAMHHIRTNGVYLKQVRKQTKGKLALYLDSDYPGWDKYFDLIFTVIQPQRTGAYVYGGWGADPKYFYPDQEERAVFLDNFNLEKPRGRENIFKTYEHILPTLKLRLYRPYPVYNQGRRLRWPEMQEIMRKCHYYCCTQDGESGLTRIEAATCGALLVVPKLLYRPRTMGSLEHRIWVTRKDLMEILSTETDPKAISQKALKHSWDAVVSRMIKKLG